MDDFGQKVVRIGIVSCLEEGETFFDQGLYYEKQHQGASRKFEIKISQQGISWTGDGIARANIGRSAKLQARLCLVKLGL